MASEKCENDKELTSTTMGSVLSSTPSSSSATEAIATVDTDDKEEKNDTGDATPTSSTDAASSSSASVAATTLTAISDDPISSTSSEAVAVAAKLPEAKMDSNDDNLLNFDKDAELRAIGMHHVSDEKITENVDDLVQDLENLLGEQTDDFTLSKSTPNKQQVEEKHEDVKVTETSSSVNSAAFQMQDVQVENVGQSSQETEETSTNKNSDNTPTSSSILTNKDSAEQNLTESNDKSSDETNQEQVKDISQTDSESTSSNNKLFESQKVLENQSKLESVEENIQTQMEVDNNCCTSSKIDIELKIDEKSLENQEVKDKLTKDELKESAEEETNNKVSESTETIVQELHEDKNESDNASAVKESSEVEISPTSEEKSLNIQENVEEKVEKDQTSLEVKADLAKVEILNEVVEKTEKVEESLQNVQEAPQKLNEVFVENKEVQQIIKEKLNDEPQKLQEDSNTIHEDSKEIESPKELKESQEYQESIEQPPESPKKLQEIPEKLQEISENLSQKPKETSENQEQIPETPDNSEMHQEAKAVHQIVEKAPESIEHPENINLTLEKATPEAIHHEAAPVVRKLTPYDREVVNAFGKDFTEDIVPPIEESLLKVIQEQAAASSASPIRPSIIRKSTSTVSQPVAESSSAIVNQFVPEVIENIVLDAPIDNREHTEIVTIQQAVASIMDDTDSSILKITTVTAAGNSNVTSSVQQKSVEQPTPSASVYSKAEKVAKIDRSDKIDTKVDRSEKIDQLVDKSEKKLDKNDQKIEKKERKADKKLTDSKEQLKEPLSINVNSSSDAINEKEKIYSPKITIKPIRGGPEEEISTTSTGGSTATESEAAKGSLKMTITKQSDNTHSILKIYNPEDVESENGEEVEEQQPTVPKLVIKPVTQQNEQQPSPKMTTRSSKQQQQSAFHSPSATGVSPRITIKPIKSEAKSEATAPLKITIKTNVKADELPKQKSSPKLTIKPIKTDEEILKEHAKVQSPRITIKPIPQPTATESVECGTSSPTPKITIKPIKKPDELDVEAVDTATMGRSSPKITIKPVLKPSEDTEADDVEEVKERIVLKINKGNLPSKESKKREHGEDNDKSMEKLAKIKLKFSKEGGHPQIVQSHHKRQHEDSTPSAGERKKLRSVEMVDSTGSEADRLDNVPSPIVISEDSNDNSGSVIVVEDGAKDLIDDIPMFDMSANSSKNLSSQASSPSSSVASTPQTPSTPTMPRKRGRPRKVPLVVREEFKDDKDESLQVTPVEMPVTPTTTETSSGRPKRSCRGGQNVRDTLGLKTRKPRGGGRGRGSRRGMGNRVIDMKPAKEPKLSKAKLRLLQQEAAAAALLGVGQQEEHQEEFKPFEKADVELKAPNPLSAPPPPAIKADAPTSSTTATNLPVSDSADIVMFEEETRMSAETNSRAQTPAKQVVEVARQSIIEIEESQSSFLSNATTESKASLSTPRPSKAAKLDVVEPEGSVLSADDLAEYYWGGNGPFMLQEQVAQFLGIKSFKRKYPGIPRRMVDMQERDFIRESGLASEAMCDLGLTAVNSSDILDIMYTDFQDKYEQYCKHKRDREAKDLTNKQKALLAASQEKNKVDITEQARQSAASWNMNFNKARREQRKASMDLQTLNVHYPKNKMKQINKPKVGNYPVALVPGQFTDYYKEFTPTEINNLPLNTMCYDPINVPQDESDDDSGSDGSESDSDSTSSSSDSSDSSSGIDDCKLCKPQQVAKKVVGSVTPTVAAATK